MELGNVLRLLKLEPGVLAATDTGIEPVVVYDLVIEPLADVWLAILGEVMLPPELFAQVFKN